MNIKEFTYDKFTYMFNRLNMLDDFVDLVYNREQGLTEEQQTDLNNRTKEVLDKQENQVLLVDLVHKIVYGKKFGRINKYLYSMLFKTIANKKERNKIQLIIAVILSRIFNINKITEELTSLFEVFNECFTLCFRVYGALMLDPPPDISQKKHPSLKYFDTVSGVSDTYVNYDTVFKDVNRVCRSHGGLTEKEANEAQIVSLFVRYAKLMERTNGETNGNLQQL